jgi:selT/selW/selH-like putative selenoprotein
VTLVAGSNGIFDVVADGKTVYSKDQKGRFPEPGEVTKTLKGG